MHSSAGAQLVQHAVAGLVLSIFVGSILWSVSLTLGALVALWLYGVGAVTPWLVLALQAVVAWLPLGEHTPRLVQRFVRFSCACSKHYFPIRVVVEDEQSLKPDQAYILALEPHSALPTAMPAVFSADSSLVPPALYGRCNGMVADVCFSVPWVRQLYWWWGFRPVTKGSICSLLARGRCPVLVPGGVQECLYMQQDSELAYLRRRHGFIRLAIQQGVPVVPVFAFGQSQIYNWWRLGPPLISQSSLNQLARVLRCAPLVLYGRWGSIVPNSVPMTVVIGKPLQMPHVDTPTHDLVQEHLDKYIAALQQLFEGHKAAAGHPKLQLHIM